MPRSIVILSSIEWNFTWQRHQALACEFSKIFPKVVFVESFPKRFPESQEIMKLLSRFSRSVRQQNRNLVKQTIPKNVSIISPITFPAVSAPYRKINRNLFINKLANRIETQAGAHPIIINYSPTATAVDLCRALKPRKLIYDYVDRITTDQRTNQYVISSHKEMLNLANVVITPSEQLANDVWQFIEDKPIVVPHGVDFDLFNSIWTPAIPNSIHKLIYFGSIGIYLDYEFISTLSKEKQIILMGPNRINLKPDKNLVIYPAVPHHQIVNEIKKCDGILLPYKNDDYAQGVNPIKLLESFATGKPVIGTPIPAIKQYQDIMIVADNSNDALEKMNNLHLWENSATQKARLDIAQQYTWMDSAKTILSLMD